ncbi:RagB/SusD family nutrient uptake outer membrane protein [Pedobacter gandavensis]|uniref:RagB/SusD family nutrient uptake outer membrane protein n=1 Tax=Pedobacter gandavensis TaxID=2679963 RepID=A0ABR6EQQ3_9SPHI|nr:RagB/SusD family nutrient uptake outer membrane protein [Pedobacter gandavensis]MBB2147576.1 RagB/SusD family nutrient uptake outer membrane protein [Pedobacter gandavensis]
MKLNINNFKIKAAVLLVLAALTLGGCKKALDLQPLNAYTEKDVWKDPKLAQVFVNSIYDQTVLAYPDGGFGWGAQTDELYGNFNWKNENLYVRGEATPDNQSSGSLNHWNKMYGSIRYSNIFFSKIDNISGADKVVNIMKGEVHFLRALAYFELLKRFGGVPLITKVYDVNDRTFTEKRANWTETKDFIKAEIAEAIKLLPAVYTSDNDKGRATIGAAMALKSRLLLYAASPYYNKANDRALWEEAKVAAKALIDFTGANYALYGNAANGTYNKTFLDFFNSEIIFSRVYSGLVMADQYNTVSRDLSPNGYNGYSSYNVLQQMVDDFEMADGTKFSWNNPDQAKNPYEHREPRFYASVLANNQQFKGRLTSFYEGGDDSPQSPYSPWNASKTRYCVRKMVNEAHDWNVQEYDATQWAVFRLSEIYLNYAEACAALGEDGDALIYLNKIRTEKAGMGTVSATGPALMEKIRHERRIELCFEGHRYFDIRRWGIAEIGSEDAKGVIIKKQPNGSFTYELMTVQERTWIPSFYYYPIPRTEIQKNPNLIQNPNYN